MGYDFEVNQQITVTAASDVIWDAIATGPGIDSWFMGRTQVEPGLGGTVRTVFGDYTPESSITAWDPGKRLAYGTEPEPDGRVIAYEFLIEGRNSGATVLRLVTSGFLPGDDWEGEFEAMNGGLQMFMRTLAEYVTHFPRRAATVITAVSPTANDWRLDWPSLHRSLGLTAPTAVGDAVRIKPAGLPPIHGVVYFSNQDTIGIRTSDALYRFLGGYLGPIIAAHHLFTDNVDEARIEAAWQDWLGRLSVDSRSH